MEKKPRNSDDPYLHTRSGVECLDTFIETALEELGHLFKRALRHA
jgi:hypothetical protein